MRRILVAASLATAISLSACGGEAEREGGGRFLEEGEEVSHDHDDHDHDDDDHDHEDHDHEDGEDHDHDHD